MEERLNFPRWRILFCNVIESEIFMKSFESFRLLSLLPSLNKFLEIGDRDQSIYLGYPVKKH